MANHYAEQPSLARGSYAMQLDSLLQRCFGTADAYSRYLRELGHEAVDLIVNCEPLQIRWATEHRAAALRRVAARIPGLRTKARRELLRAIVEAQIDEFAPEILYVQDLSVLDGPQSERLRKKGVLLVGQLASGPPEDEVLSRYDLLVTSFPHFVEHFRAQQRDAEYLEIAFYEPVLDRLREIGVDASPDAERPRQVTFVGGINPNVHPGGVALLERVCGPLQIDVWGYGAEDLPPASPILERYRGQAWGLDMYRALAQSQIVINRHIEAAEGHANNMRLYEATGVGALLMTEAAPNLPELFEPGREIVTYDGADDLLDKARHYLDHDDERRRIAAAGQARTLSEHTYAKRIQELVPMLEARLS